MKTSSRISLLLVLLLSFSNSIAQSNNPYLGLWEGYFTSKFPDGKVTHRKFQLDLHSMNRDTLFGKAISYTDGDSTKIDWATDQFLVIYNAYDKSFHYKGYAAQADKRFVMGTYEFVFSNTANSTVLGTFIPLAPSRRDPDISVTFNRQTLAKDKKAFSKALNDKVYDKKTYPEYENCQCDDKVYSLVRGFIYDTEKDKFGGMGETSNGESIREFQTLYPSVTEILIHKQKLPFPSVALAKGFDNMLYSVSSSRSDVRLRVYRYNPKTHKGAYTRWILPSAASASTSHVRWLSGGTDPKGNIYFMTENAEKFVKINPVTDEVSIVWETCPLGDKKELQDNPLLANQNSFGNFCFDELGRIHLITGRHGNVIEIDISEDTPKVLDMYAIQGLPETGIFSAAGEHYGDILIQKDPEGKTRTYVTGGHEIYEINLDQRKVVGIVAPFINADLAGCNIFKKTPVALVEEVKRSASPDKPVTAIPATPIPIDLKISFQQSKAEFLDRDDAYKKLNEWIERMKIHPSMTIEITGHTDNQGDERINLKLSQNRAILIKKYFMEKGISGGRIRSQGKGHQVPRASNDTEEGRIQNRRVELSVITS